MEKGELQRWNEWVNPYHYLSSRLVGPPLRYVAERDGEWVVLMSIGSAAVPWEDRDRHIGGDEIQRGRRLEFIGQTNRWVVLADPQRYANLVSRTMRLMTRGVSADWRAQYGHPLFGLETFVDPQYFQGAGYKASGGRALGTTQGDGRRR